MRHVVALTLLAVPVALVIVGVVGVVAVPNVITEYTCTSSSNMGYAVLLVLGALLLLIGAMFVVAIEDL